MTPEQVRSTVYPAVGAMFSTVPKLVKESGLPTVSLMIEGRVYLLTMTALDEDLRPSLQARRKMYEWAHQTD